MKTKQCATNRLSTVAVFLLARITLCGVFLAPVWVATSLVSIPEIALAVGRVAAVMVYFRFQEDLIDRIAPRFGVTQLNGR
jgi:hypothetical protein